MGHAARQQEHDNQTDAVHEASHACAQACAVPRRRLGVTLTQLLRRGARNAGLAWKEQNLRPSPVESGLVRALRFFDAEAVMEELQTTRRSIEPTGCCPPFDPATWNEKDIVWTDKLFVKDHVHSVAHIPLDMGRKVLQNQRLIEVASARPPQGLMLSDETSLWGADIYIDVTKEVPGASMATLSGRFLTKVYEGPFKQAPAWAADMRRHVASKGATIEKLYFCYTTCPRCAKAYGKNYVVLFARLKEPTFETDSIQ